MKLLIQKLSQKIDALPRGEERSEIINDYLALKNNVNTFYLIEKYKNL